MKTTITALLLFAGTALMAQTVQFENLTPFEKLVISGDVSNIKVERHHSDRPQVNVTGVDKENLATKIEAGVLYLDIKEGMAKEVVVYNGNLNRIETDQDVEIAGADIVGGHGRYLITEFRHDHGPIVNHIDIDIPRIDIDLAGLDIDIPEMDFDFDTHFDHDFDIDVDIDEDNWNFNWNWDDHKEEMRRVSKQVKEEVKKAVKEVKREVKNYKE